MFCAAIQWRPQAFAVDRTGMDLQVSYANLAIWRHNVKMRRNMILRIDADQNVSEASKRWHVFL